MAGPRSPRSVINDAIKETAGFNSLCYWGLVVFGSVGVFAIVVGVCRGDPWLGGLGTIPAGLCWPALHYAILIRKQNVALRMLELSLDDVKSANEALKAINEAFGFHFGEKEIKANVAVSDPKATGSGSGP